MIVVIIVVVVIIIMIVVIILVIILGRAGFGRDDIAIGVICSFGLNSAGNHLFADQVAVAVEGLLDRPISTGRFDPEAAIADANLDAHVARVLKLGDGIVDSVIRCLC